VPARPLRKGARVEGRNGSRLDAYLLTNEEIELLMRQCSRRAPTGVRNRALIAVLWRSGLRIGEARGLAVKDLDPDSGTLVAQRGKGGKRRVVGVDSGTIALIGRWLDRRRKLGLPAGGAPLFCSLAGKPSTCRTSAPAARLARKASIERVRPRATPRVRSRPRPLRRALYVVRDALIRGIATTQVYLSRVGAHEAVEAMRYREWSPE
jgi:integrase